MKISEQEIRLLLGKRIRSLRKSKGLTQQELGERADINHKFLGEIERGRQNATVGTLVKIADALSIDIIEVFRISHEITSKKKLESEILKKIERASADELQQILLIVNALFPFHDEGKP